MTDGVRLMAAAFSGLYQVQKDIIHNYFVEVVTKICTWETKVGRDELFGVDILKKLDEKYTVCCVLKMHEPNPFKPYNDTDCGSEVSNHVVFIADEEQALSRTVQWSWVSKHLYQEAQEAVAKFWQVPEMEASFLGRRSSRDGWANRPCEFS